MAGDWIKCEIGTPDKPEIWAIAGAIGIDPDAAFGKLFRVWAWFDQHTEEGNAPAVTKMLLDRLVGITGFCDAVIESGWMIDNEDEISLPNFDRHNGVSAKKRADAARRKAKSRSGVTKSCDDKVTIPRKLRDKVYQRDNHQCVYCGFTEENRPAFGDYANATLSIDHVIPESMGGETSYENTVTCCTICNNRKNNRTPEEAGMLAKYVTKECDISVTKALPREEKRREEKRREEIKPPHSPAHDEVLEGVSTPIPDAFSVTDQHREYARIHALPNPDGCVLKFINHHQSKGTRSQNWDAEFRKWLANEKVYSAARPKSAGGGKHTGFDKQNYGDGIDVDGRF